MDLISEKFILRWSSKVDRDSLGLSEVQRDSLRSSKVERDSLGLSKVNRYSLGSRKTHFGRNILTRKEKCS